jgi:tRNA threonylcarbamoyladenosine biosynthesis protein TsaE
MTDPSDTAGESATRPSPQVELRSTSPDQTQRLGALLGRLAQAGDILLLQGELGSGKTALAQGLGRGLGVRDVINSPTFTILKEYRGRLPLYHFDLYRIEDPEELLALGFEDYFGGDGVCVVEWPERGETDSGDGGPLWPSDWLRIELEKQPGDQRTLRCTSAGSRGQALLVAFAQAVAAEKVG